MTNEENLLLFRQSQKLLIELIDISPLCEAEMIRWQQEKGTCKRMKKLFDSLLEVNLNPGVIQQLVNAGLITQQEKVDYTKNYNKNKNNLKHIYNLHPKSGNGGNPGGGNPGGGNPGNGNNGQGGGPP